MHRSYVGKIGEDITAQYLNKKGFMVLERNFRKPWGELDIIAKHRDGTLVFIEVKTMIQKYVNGSENDDGLSPEDNLTGSKLKKLRRTASMYAAQNQKLVNDNRGWRIDLVALKIFDLEKIVGMSAKNANNLTSLIKDDVDFRVSHYENI